MAFFWLLISITGFGPAIGPIVSGYLSNRSWRLPFWVGSGIAIGSLLLLLITPETYGPTILKKKAQKARKDGNENTFAEIELQESNIAQRVRELCIMPPKMFVTEPLVFCTCTFMAFVYGVFYVFFQAYHRVYEGQSSKSVKTELWNILIFRATDGYHLTPGEAGLTFLSRMSHSKTIQRLSLTSISRNGWHNWFHCIPSI
jgi:MFS family permease